MILVYLGLHMTRRAAACTQALGYARKAGAPAPPAAKKAAAAFSTGSGEAGLCLASKDVPLKNKALSNLP